MSEYYLSREEQPAPTATKPPKTPSGGEGWSKLQIWLTGIGIFLLAGFIYFIYLLQDLPDLTNLENVNPAQVTRVYSADNKVIHELFRYNRIWLPYERISPQTINATIATEDRSFDDHWGVDVYGIPRAIAANIISMRLVQGFSTITMQVARNLYESIGFERSVNRKLKEIMTAIQIERTYSKQEIIEMYLNVSYFGGGSYGLQSASKTYFGKDASDLSVEEGALLVGLLKGPNYYHPVRNPERALQRRNIVLHNMLVCDNIDQAQYDSLKNLPLTLGEGSIGDAYMAPYFTEYVRQELNKLQDSLSVDIYEDGLNVYTTINTVHQAAMDSAIIRQMPRVQERVRSHLLKWKKEEGIEDSVFLEKSEVQIAFIALDQRTGHITAMTGGRDFEKTKFNRAMQAKRQPGSTFKPFLYASAIDNGYSTTDRLFNQPVVLVNPDGTRWTPENFDKEFGGPTTLREGIRKSINLVAARLIQLIGPKVVVDYAHRLGIHTPLQPYPSLAMGSASVIPLDMVSAFGVFGNQGVRVEPVAITRIEDRLGNVIYETYPRQSEVLGKATSYIITDMLSTAINLGTGGSARWKYGFNAPAAGKTGTTNDYTDAWFIGFTPLITAGVWVGLDSPELKLGPGGTGSEIALPFWADFMKTIYEELKLPHKNFVQPSEVVNLDICQDTGKIATNFCPNVLRNEVFNSKHQPTETCPQHPGGIPANQRRNRVF